MVDQTYLYHLTLDTGHARKSYRSEISDDALRLCAELVERIKQSPGIPLTLPGPPGYTISALISGQCMSAQVFADANELPLISFAVAARERCGAAIWKKLGGPDGKQPDAPWLAVRLEVGIVSSMAATEWLGDFERCVGWAFLESRAANL